MINKLFFLVLLTLLVSIPFTKGYSQKWTALPNATPILSYITDININSNNQLYVQSASQCFGRQIVKYDTTGWSKGIALACDYGGISKMIADEAGNEYAVVFYAQGTNGNYFLFKINNTTDYDIDDSGINPNFITSYFYSVAPSPSGDIYASGYFCLQRNIKVGKWDTTTHSWIDLKGTGADTLSARPQQLIYTNYNSLFALVNNSKTSKLDLSEWDGTNWNSLNTLPATDTIKTLYYNNGVLYANGYFKNGTQISNRAHYFNTLKKWQIMLPTDPYLYADTCIKMESIIHDRWGNNYGISKCTNSAGQQYVAKIINGVWQELPGLNANFELTALALDTSGNIYSTGGASSFNNYVAKYAAQTPILSIDLKDTSTCSFTVDVPVRGFNLTGMTSLQGSIGWDTTYLNFGVVKLVNNGLIPDSLSFNESLSFDYTNVAKGKITYKWMDSISHYFKDSTPVFILSFYPKNNFSGGTGIWFDSIPLKLQITKDIGGYPFAVIPNANYNDGWVLLSDTPQLVQTGNIIQCIDGCTHLHYQWYNNDIPMINDTLNYIVADSSGNYSVVVTNVRGKSTLSSVLKLTMPVSIQSFNVNYFASSGVAEDGTSLLKWQLTNEQNIRQYNIQRSIDGIHFSTIDSVIAKGNGMYNYYSDHIASALYQYSKIYYRLEILSTSKYYSEPRNVILSKYGSQFNIAPNPAKDYVLITDSNIKQIRLTDNTGRIVVIKDAGNANTIRIVVNNLSKGLYMVQVLYTDGRTKTEKLLVEN